MDASRLLQLMHAQTEELVQIMLDHRGAVVAWMMGAEKVFGRSAEEMAGRTLHCLFTQEDQAAGIPEDELDQARRANKGEDDRWMVRSDGVRFWATGFVHALRDGDGNVVGYTKILRDRTDLRARFEAMRNRAEALAAEDARKVVMLGTLAHELRNPLSAVSNAIELIDRAYPADPRLAYALQILNRQVKYVSTLIEDLLEVVRVRTGKALLHYETIDVAALVVDAVETVDTVIREREQRVETFFPPAPIVMEGDRVRLKQVLVNLLHNAAKFSDRGRQIWVKASIEGDEVLIRVEDSGRGIPAGLLPHVFELLTQATDDDAPREAGLGLGLALVREYVELHGGTVQVRSDGIGRGSEFAVRVPRTPPRDVRGVR